MQFLISAAAIALVLGMLICFHELGHFLVARAMGVGVPVFSFGFGPVLAKFRTRNTEYRLSAVPLGGFVQLVGEQEGDEPPEGYTEKHMFNKRPAWQRMLVVAAGPVFNFVLALLIYWGLFMAHGQTELLPVIGEVDDNSPAQAAGLQSGDQILSINAQNIEYWRNLAAVIHNSEGETLQLRVERGGQILPMQVTPELRVHKNLFGEDVKTPLIGIRPAQEEVTIPLNLAQAFTAGVQQTWSIISLTFQGIIKLIERVVPLETVGGPIMIAELVHKQTREGLTHVLALTALISVNLGLLNLMPIPVLDGGHILFFGIEAVTRRPVNRRVQEVTTKIGLALLITLMALAVYNDIVRIFTPES